MSSLNMVCVKKMTFIDQNTYRLNLACYWIRYMQIRYMRGLSWDVSIAYNEVHLYLIIQVMLFEKNCASINWFQNQVLVLRLPLFSE